MKSVSDVSREDQRVRVTKTMIKDAFFALMSHKAIQSITVKELCETAQVSRGTFYLHYKDIYDLLEQLENEMLKDLEDLLDKAPVVGYQSSPEASDGLVGALLGFFEKNKEMCDILLGDNGDKKFVAKIIDVGREKSVTGYRAMFPTATEQQVDIFYTFVAWGFVGLIQYALQTGSSISFAVLAAGAEKIIAEGARYLGSV